MSVSGFVRSVSPSFLSSSLGITYWFTSPLSPETTISGVWPPLKPNGTFPCAF
jgi:hypothetical protein